MKTIIAGAAKRLITSLIAVVLLAACAVVPYGDDGYPVYAGAPLAYPYAGPAIGLGFNFYGGGRVGGRRHGPSRWQEGRGR